jgi:hypothetical protein
VPADVVVAPPAADPAVGVDPATAAVLLLIVTPAAPLVLLELLEPAEGWILPPGATVPPVVPGDGLPPVLTGLEAIAVPPFPDAPAPPALPLPVSLEHAPSASERPAIAAKRLEVRKNDVISKSPVSPYSFSCTKMGKWFTLTTCRLAASLRSVAWSPDQLPDAGQLG